MVNKNKSFSLTAEVEVPEGGVDGVIIAQGGAFGGSLYVKDGKPAYCYNLFGLQHFKVYGEAVPAGEHQVRMEFAYDGGGLGKGGDVALYLDGERSAGPRRRDRADALLADETTDLGSDTATPVSDDYGPKDSGFTGGCAGSDRPRRGRGGCRPPDHVGGAPGGCDGEAVAGLEPCRSNTSRQRERLS